MTDLTTLLKRAGVTNPDVYPDVPDGPPRGSRSWMEQRARKTRARAAQPTVQPMTKSKRDLIAGNLATEEAERYERERQAIMRKRVAKKLENTALVLQAANLLKRYDPQTGGETVDAEEVALAVGLTDEFVEEVLTTHWAHG